MEDILPRTFGISTRLLAAGAILLLAVGPALGQRDGPPIDVPADVLDELQDSFIFVFDRTVDGRDASRRSNALVAATGGTVRHVYTTALRGFAARMPAEAAARLAARNPEIAYYESDGPVFAIGAVRAAAAPGASAAPHVIPAGVTRVGGPANGIGLTAWIIDTGIDLDHPDLNVDAARSATFVRGPRNANDRNGHGTHVAGTIAALDNDIDVVGVAAGAALVAVKVLGRSGSGTISGVIAGVDYVAANASPGDVANMSLGGGASGALDAAVRGAAGRGILFAVAAGNDGAYAGSFSPARVEHPNVFTVSAVDHGDRFASFSNWGTPPVDFAAPGVNILSTLAGGGVVNSSGTSMAAPHVAGVLLVTGGEFLANNGGTLNHDGCAIGDPDGNPDPIVHIFAGAPC